MIVGIVNRVKTGNSRNCKRERWGVKERGRDEKEAGGFNRLTDKVCGSTSFKAAEGSGRGEEVK